MPLGVVFRPGAPQFTVSGCPDILAAELQARRLLRRCTIEQLIYSTVQAPADQAGHERKRRMIALIESNPRPVTESSPQALSQAAAYPEVIAAASATPAARDRPEQSLLTRPAPVRSQNQANGHRGRHGLTIKIPHHRSASRIEQSSLSRDSLTVRWCRLGCRAVQFGRSAIVQACERGFAVSLGGRGADVGCYDLAVVGAGIVGLAVAREFLRRRPGSRLIVIDKQARVGYHQTGHNSGVIHSGVYYRPGSLKARLCVEGARLMYEFCDANAIAYERCGKLIVAVRADELPRLAELEARGHANGVPGLCRVGAGEIADIEPECRGLAALHAPGTGIVDYGAVARALEGELRGMGVAFALGCAISGVRRERGRTVLAHAAGCYQAAWSIVCAGLWSGRLAVSAGASPDPRIVPFRGAYLRLAAGQPRVVRGMVYPVPDPQLPFLGVHVTRHIDGHVMLGPTAMLVGARDAYNVRTVRPRDLLSALSWPGTWIVARKFWRTGIGELRMAASRQAFVRACAQYVPVIESMTIDSSAASGGPGPGGGPRRETARRFRDLVYTGRHPRQERPIPGSNLITGARQGTRRPLRGNRELNNSPPVAGARGKYRLSLPPCIEQVHTVGAIAAAR
jgi:(S)-2-hydroxyglutarate dehydrogenase